MIPIAESASRDLREIGNVLIDDDTFSTIVDIAIKHGSRAAEQSHRRNLVAPIAVAGSGEIAQIRPGIPALLASLKVGPIVNTKALADLLSVGISIRRITRLIASIDRRVIRIRI